MRKKKHQLFYGFRSGDEADLCLLAVTLASSVFMALPEAGLFLRRLFVVDCKTACRQIVKSNGMLTVRPININKRCAAAIPAFN